MDQPEAGSAYLTFHNAYRRCIDLSYQTLEVDRVVQPPVRLSVAGIAVASLILFMGRFSYGRSEHALRLAAEAARRPSEVHGVDVATLQAQVTPPAVSQKVPLTQKAQVAPVEQKAEPKATPAIATGLAPERSLVGIFAWPVNAPISSPFGPRDGRNHNGVDLAANMGDSIRAARDGEVLLSGTVPGYGLTVVLRHGDGTRTLYGHASRLLVRAGQRVKQGEAIARVGSTGRSTGPHLHFEIIVQEKPRDPLLYLPKR